MTTEGFIKAVEGYYDARYPAGQAPAVRAYVARLSDRALDYLFAETIKIFSSQYGRCPDVAIFERARVEARDRLEYDQDLTVPAITEDAGNEVDVSKTIAELDGWLKGRSEYARD